MYLFIYLFAVLQLGVKIVDAKTCIETALELSRNLQIDVSALNTWLNSVESELTQLEAIPDADRDIEIEMAFVTVSSSSMLLCFFQYCMMEKKNIAKKKYP